MCTLTNDTRTAIRTATNTETLRPRRRFFENHHLSRIPARTRTLKRVRIARCRIQPNVGAEHAVAGRPRTLFSNVGISMANPRSNGAVHFLLEQLSATECGSGVLRFRPGATNRAQSASDGRRRPATAGDGRRRTGSPPHTVCRRSMTAATAGKSVAQGGTVRLQHVRCKL